jgi:hypothetical protein
MLSALLVELDSGIPDPEKFNAPASTIAQDVVICCDAAVRAAIPTEVVNPSWIKYAIEAVSAQQASQCSEKIRSSMSDVSVKWF